MSVEWVPALFCGIALVLFGVACAIRGVRHLRRVLARRRAMRRFLRSAADPEARVVKFIGYGPAGPTHYPHNDEEAAR